MTPREIRAWEAMKLLLRSGSIAVWKYGGTDGNPVGFQARWQMYWEHEGDDTKFHATGVDEADAILALLEATGNMS